MEIFYHWNIGNVFIVFEIILWPNDADTFSILKFVVWRWLKMLLLIAALTWCTVKDLMQMDFVSLSGDRERVSRFRTKVTIFEDDNSYSVYADNRKKKISILGKDLTNGLDDTAIIAEAKYFINFGEQKINFAWFCTTVEYLLVNG